MIGGVILKMSYINHFIIYFRLFLQTILDVYIYIYIAYAKQKNALSTNTNMVIDMYIETCSCHINYVLLVMCKEGLHL
jgi:hypothetical protein